MDPYTYLVRSLKRTCPALGKKKIAQVLARAGLHLGVSTVGRLLERDLSRTDVGAELPVVEELRPVRAKAPNDVWHVDLTVVPTAAGFWVPSFPFAKLQRWPFAWWVAVAVDQASRLVVGFAVFKRRPTSAEVCSFLERAIKRVKTAPRTIITDQGSEFGWAFRRWCRRGKISRRLGKVGEHGSIAIVERFIRSMKSECTRRLIVPFRLAAMRAELGSYATWFNEHRPHEVLRGRTPIEVYRGLQPRNEAPRFEPRTRWPKRARCAAPNVPVNGKAGAHLKICLSRLERRAHLPIISLRRAG